MKRCDTHRKQWRKNIPFTIDGNLWHQWTYHVVSHHSIWCLPEKMSAGYCLERCLLTRTQRYSSGTVTAWLWWCLPWIWTTVHNVSQRWSHEAAPPDESVLGVSYHRQIEVSVLSLIPLRLLNPIASSKALRLENVPPGYTHHPSTPFLGYHTSPPSSLQPLTLVLPIHSEQERWLCGGENWRKEG